MAAARDSSFVADGRDRARKACEAAVRASVEQKYAEELATANWFRRRLLRRRIKREVERLLDEKAPPDALYLSSRTNQATKPRF